MTNRQQNDHNDASSSNPSSSNPSSSAEKRKEHNKRYYALRKERNKQLKVGNGDVSQSSSLISSIERTPLGTLQTNTTQMPQIQRENVSCTMTQRQKEYHQRYYAAHENNGIQTRTDENTPVTAIHSLTEQLMPEIS